MKTKLLTVIPIILLLFGCSNDNDPVTPKEPEPQPKPNYRDEVTGSYDCKVTHHYYRQGDPPLEKDTFATITISKDQGKDSAISVNLFSEEELYYLKPSNIIHIYTAFSPRYYGDSSGYFKKDSIYLNWRVFSSPGGSEFYIIKGKKQ